MTRDLKRKHTKGVKYWAATNKRFGPKSKPAGWSEQNDKHVAELLTEMKLIPKNENCASFALPWLLIGKDFENVSQVREHLRSLDRFTVHRMLVPFEQRSALSTAVCHQILEKLDLDGRYTGFWQWVPKRIYDLLPGLYHYPLDLARALDRIGDDAEATAMFAIVEIITNTAVPILTHNTTYRRNCERAHVIVTCKFFIWIMRSLPILHPCTVGQAFPYSHYLHSGISHSELTTLLDALFIHPNICILVGSMLVPAVKYLNHAIEKGVILFNVKEPIVLPANLYQQNNSDEGVEKPERSRYTDADVAAMVNACDNPRIKLIVLILRDLALRCTAIRHLTIKDVWDTATGMPRIYATCTEKFGHTRDIELHSADMLPAMKKHLETHKFKSKYLFPASRTAKDSPPMSGGTMYELVKRIARRAGVKYAGLHQFRHWKVGNMIANGVSIEVVSMWIGHRSVATTYGAYWKPKSGEIRDQITNQEAAFKESLHKKKSVQSKSSSGSTLVKMTNELVWYKKALAYLSTSCPGVKEAMGQFVKLNPQKNSPLTESSAVVCDGDDSDASSGVSF
jgi:hypothetical protein